MIALAAWWHISHGVVMAIQTVEAWIHSVHRNFTDVIVFLVIGVVLYCFCQQNERQSRQSLRERAQEPHTLRG
jgi:heme A synthase